MFPKGWLGSKHQLTSVVSVSAPICSLEADWAQNTNLQEYLCVSPDMFPRGWLGSKHQLTSVISVSAPICSLEADWAENQLTSVSLPNSGFRQTVQKSDGLCDMRQARNKRQQPKALSSKSSTTPSWSLHMSFDLKSIEIYTTMNEVHSEPLCFN